MAEYIEREEIMNRLFTEYATDSKADVFELIRSIPAADVQPQKHGRWELTNNPSFRKCSECGAWWGKEFTTNNHVNYCPRCGVDMRELNE